MRVSWWGVSELVGEWVLARIVLSVSVFYSYFVIFDILFGYLGKLSNFEKIKASAIPFD